MIDGGKQKILIVDDERANILALAQILKPSYDILVAKNGQTALSLAQETVPDLILLDIIMPDMDGFEVLVRLKSFEVVRNVPVIFITGLHSEEDEEKGFFLGAVDYITKPFHNSVVKARVKTHLQMSEYIRKIEHMCMIDALTGIPNRRAFDERLGVEWSRAVREQTPLGLLMIDVDKFKDYNDVYGHPQGDALLKAVANGFKQSLRRQSDFAARWGGEEFAVLLPGTKLTGAVEVAEKIRANVEKTAIPCVNGTDTRVTVSIGVSSVVPVMGDTADSIIAAADKCLYTAKNTGRNRVCS